MSLPKYHETFIPILETLNTKGSLSSKGLKDLVRKNYYSNLAPTLLNEKTSSGINVLLDRIGWGKSYLKMAKLVTYPTKGEVQITKKGKEILEKGQFSLKELKEDSDYKEHRLLVDNNKKDNQPESNTDNLEYDSPQDSIDKGISTIEELLKDELLEKFKEINPYEFEKVILLLLKKMDYGDFIETPKSNDKGIDGIINQDKLGLEKIYTQAKRYTDIKVNESDIRNFIGAMSGDTHKGVFITTSTFNDSAVQKAKEAHHSIILIDGRKLVDLMYQYNIGVQIKTTYAIKELDNDFFEEV